MPGAADPIKTSPAESASKPHEPLFRPAVLKLAAVVLLVTVVPVLTIVILLFGSGAATTAIFGVLVGMLNIVLGGRNTAFAASFALIIMAPISVMAGLNPVTGAAVMAISCLAIGASAGWGLQRGLSMLPLAIAFLIISPPAVSNTPTDRISTPYLLTVVAIMAISSLIPVIVLTFLLRHKELPKPQRNNRADSIEYAIIISVTTSVAMFGVLAIHPSPYSFWLLLTLIAVVQVGPQASLRKTIQRASGTVIGGAVAAVIVILIPNSTVLFAIGMLMLLVAFNFIGSTRYWLYIACMTPTIVLTSGAPAAASTDVARVSYTLIGAALAVVAFAISHVVRLIMSNREQDADKTPAAAPRTA